MAAWSGDLTLRFIEMYKCRSVLWDPKNLNHKNKYHRQEALLEISEELGIDRYELERKIKNLTSHYFRERRKTDSLKKNRTQKPYKSKWFAFKALDFLRGRNEPWYNIPPEPSEMVEIEMKDTNTTTRNGQTKENEDLYESGELPLKCEVQTDDESDNDAVRIGGGGSVVGGVRKSLKLDSGQSPRDHLINKDSDDGTEADIRGNYANNNLGGCAGVLLPSSASSPGWNNHYYERTDEFGLLGEEVAMKVRKLPTKYARCLVQYKIQRLLFRAALGKYDNPPPSSEEGVSEGLVDCTATPLVTTTGNTALISTPASSSSMADVTKATTTTTIDISETTSCSSSSTASPSRETTTSSI